MGTLTDIYQFYPKLKTCTIVPVGLTKHRQGLMDIPTVDEKYAKHMLYQLIDLRKEFPGTKSPFILLSDEWYLLAKVSLPDLDEYGNAELWENGVGQVSYFYNRFHSDAIHFPKQLKKPYKITLVTGTLIADHFISEILPVFKRIKNLHVTIVPIKNNFYGESVTVSGLLIGRDIINQLKETEKGDEIWISHRILNDEGICTLDDMTLDDISAELECPVKVGKDSFLELLNGIYNV